MKRYDCTMHDKRGAFGLCMEARSEGQFVPFTKVEQLQAKIFGLQEERNSTGIAINNAIRSGILPDKHPLRSRLELLANHHKREQALADGMVAMSDRCQLLADLLRESRTNVDQVHRWGRFDHDEGCGAEAALLLERIDAVLAGQVSGHPGRPLDMVPDGWQLVPVDPTIPMLAAFVEVGGKANCGYKAMLAAAPKPEPTNGRAITEGQEFELTAVLQSIANGFSDDPAHDAAALLKRITGEVQWTGDSFQLPPRQGGEPCDSASPSSSPA